MRSAGSADHWPACLGLRAEQQLLNVAQAGELLQLAGYVLVAQWPLDAARDAEPFDQQGKARAVARADAGKINDGKASLPDDPVADVQQRPDGIETQFS